MAKPASRPYSRYANEALRLMGGLIENARRERRETLDGLAERAGISRPLLRRIEAGDPGCSVGAVFEVASLLGIKLFGMDLVGLRAENRRVSEGLALLPDTARPLRKRVKDDF